VWRLESSTSLDSSGLMVERGGVGESGASLIIINKADLYYFVQDFVLHFYILEFDTSTFKPNLNLVPGNFC
jgi:hypothetical protein